MLCLQESVLSWNWNELSVTTEVNWVSMYLKKIQSPKKYLEVLFLIFVSYLAINIMNSYKNITILYFSFLVALFCTILIPGYYLSRILLKTEHYHLLPRVGIFYLSFQRA